MVSDRGLARSTDAPLPPRPARGVARTRETGPGGPPTGPRPVWQRRFARAVVGVDLVATAGVAVAGHVADLGEYGLRLFGEGRLPIAPVAAALTLFCLSITRAWEPAVLGQGAEEFSRVVRAVTTSAVALGMLGLALVTAGVRPWVFGLIPLIGLLSILGRWGLRRGWLHRRRTAGHCMHPMLAVGTVEAVTELVLRTRRDPFTGWRVTAACTPTGTGPDGTDAIQGVPVVGDLDAVSGAARTGRYRIVSVSPAPGWSSLRLHRLAWDLEEVGADLVVDPGLMEVAGPRLHVAPVDGLPLLRLTQPTFSGVPRVVKSAIDHLGAALLLLVLAPVMLAIAVAVKADGGPVFFRQVRVGRGGRPFKMIKFRSMVVDAERRRVELAGANQGAGPLFKLRHDPRVTRVGALLRRYSLDELPQLLNVLVGTMSLVGPRPPLPEEVARYEQDARRKFLVRPGLTGLWQVSGRSNLSWEQSVRLDLRYVENWTLAQDALILWKTVGAVTRSRGAY